MRLISIDPQRCRRDGLCASVCPLKLIQMPGPDDLPAPVAGAGEVCIRCGPCLAVCPHGALSLEGVRPDDCPPVRREWLGDPERTEHFLRSRRSIRVFRDEPVERETVERLLRVASHAPSGHNAQPVRWRVVHGPGEVRRLAGRVVEWMRDFSRRQPRTARDMHLGLITAAWDAGIDVICWEAPHVVLAHALADDPRASRDSTIALAYLDLAAPGFGVGTCWAGYFTLAAAQWPALQEDLALPPGHAVQGALMLGRPRIHFHRLPPRNDPVITWM